jgi:hypothetical protein
MPAPDSLTRRRERIAGIHGISIDAIELYDRNMIDEGTQARARRVTGRYLTSGKPDRDSAEHLL